ncbi:hypothetical protein KEM56_000381 [Ascosphaera pollenicola]|nr:hypothetical protein KEM56_000381 [Ascosphaera pollenicola]
MTMAVHKWMAIFIACFVMFIWFVWLFTVSWLMPRLHRKDMLRKQAEGQRAMEEANAARAAQLAQSMRRFDQSAETLHDYPRRPPPARVR